MTGPRPLGSAAMVRLVAAREISSRLRDKNFIISSVVIVLVLVGLLGFQVAIDSGSDTIRVGVVGDATTYGPALEAQGETLDGDVEVMELDDRSAAEAAIEDGDVDGVLLAEGEPELLVEQSTDGALQAVVQGAVSQVSVAAQLREAGIDRIDIPEVAVIALDPGADRAGQRVVIAIVGISVLYSLLLLFGQFVAQGVVEEKSSRVVELLLATMRPWQLLAGKIIGLGLLGLLGLGQIALIAAVGVGGALAFDLVDIPGDLVGTAVGVVAWFVLGYALYASIFAAVASLVSRQEDLNTVVMPMSLVLIGALVVGIQAAGDPDGPLARITSYLPGLSPLVMPVRQAAGEVALWEIALAVALMLVAIALIVRLGGRVYAGALLRTSGRIKLREAFRAERV
jgi:ABC-2 type transport system permease protein